MDDKNGFHNDWMFLKASCIVPEEIVDFMETVFRIVEIRERVGSARGIKFEVRTRENNHPLPHIHAEYGEYQISIAIETVEVIAGNLPHKQQKIAKEWVENNKDQLLSKWNDIAVSGTAMYTKSSLEYQEEKEHG